MESQSVEEAEEWVRRLTSRIGKGEVTSPATEATEGKGDLDVILMKGYV